VKIPTLYMETTTIPSAKTASEIIGVLARSGATQINSSYQNGKLIGIRWCFLVRGVETIFQMPVRIEPVTMLLKRAGRLPKSDPEKAERVAWRQLLRWIEAQACLIETGMVDQAEPFTAYAIDPRTNQTLFQLWTNQLALPAPEQQ